MKDEFKPVISQGSVVQLNKSAPGNGCYAGCFAVVSEAKAWGAECYLLIPRTGGMAPERVPIALQWKDMEYIGHAFHVQRGNLGRMANG